jgi:hypothetical protein
MLTLPFGIDIVLNGAGNENSRPWEKLRENWGVNHELEEEKRKNNAGNYIRSSRRSQDRQGVLAGGQSSSQESAAESAAQTQEATSHTFQPPPVVS